MTRRLAVLSLLLVLITLAAYWPVRRAEFINYDDADYVTDNPEVSHGLSWHGVVWAFTRVHSSNWHPLTWLSHMADCSLFGANPAGPHLVNLSFHLANTLLLLLLLWEMTGAVWRSGFVASLFALHPLHVESVAWIAERKDVLSTFFFMLTLLAYAAYVRRVQSAKSKVQSQQAGRAKWGFYCLSLLLFALGLLSKPMLVTLPFVLLLLDYWPLGRVTGEIKPQSSGQSKNQKQAAPVVADPSSSFKYLLPLVTRHSSLLLEKLPFFVLAAASSVVTFWAQKSTGTVATFETIPLSDRLANAAVAYVMYVIKAFWPAKLAVLYPFLLNLPAMKVALAALCLLGATVMSFRVAKRAPYAPVGWLWFIGMLVPVIGLVHVGGQAMADRYTYVPLIGVFIMVTWGGVDLTTRWQRQAFALAIPGAIILTGCFICTRSQIGYWQNSLSLFSHAVEATGDNAIAEEKVGYTLALSNNLPEAVRHFDSALQLSPAYQPALLNRAHTLLLLGRVDEAIADYRAAISNKPAFNEKAYYQLACALVQQKKWNDAKTNFLLALNCNRDSAEAHTGLGNLLWRERDRDGAMTHLREAVRLNPGYAEAQDNLGNALAQQQKFPEATTCLRAAVKADPNYAAALNDLAWILATQDDPAIRNVPEGVQLARRACELTRNKNAWLLDTLGVAESEAGQFPEAIHTAEQAVQVAVLAHDEITAAGLRRRLEFYRKGEAYHAIPR